jgi:hypothetical protein
MSRGLIRSGKRSLSVHDYVECLVKGNKPHLEEWGREAAKRRGWLDIRGPRQSAENAGGEYQFSAEEPREELFCPVVQMTH